jgi:DNA-binding GntR family transcriptional regulator
MPFTTGAADQPVRPPVLAQEDGVSYRTADHALQTLKDEGPIIAVRGKGFYTTHPNN